MGRHSAPDDDGDLLVAPVEEAAARPRPRPRHAASDSELVATDVIDPELVERAVNAAPGNVVDAEIVEDDVPAEAVADLEPPRPEPVANVAAPPAPSTERAAVGDLRLLRGNPSLRARCVAALVLPFILYTIALVVISRLDAYLFWIWIPAILAGVLFGAQLDMAAKRAKE